MWQHVVIKIHYLPKCFTAKCAGVTIYCIGLHSVYTGMRVLILLFHYIRPTVKQTLKIWASR